MLKHLVYTFLGISLVACGGDSGGNGPAAIQPADAGNTVTNTNTPVDSSAAVPTHPDHCDAEIALFEQSMAALGPVEDVAGVDRDGSHSRTYRWTSRAYYRTFIWDEGVPRCVVSETQEAPQAGRQPVLPAQGTVFHVFGSSSETDDGMPVVDVDCVASISRLEKERRAIWPATGLMEFHEDTVHQLTYMWQQKGFYSTFWWNTAVKDGCYMTVVQQAPETGFEAVLPEQGTFHSRR